MLAESEVEARRAAFGDRPEAELWAGAQCGSARERWLVAVAWGGAGRYAAAAGLLRPIIVGADPVLAALAGATLAAHRRQLGAHEAARRLDSAALARIAPLGLPAQADPAAPPGTDPAALPGTDPAAPLGLSQEAGPAALRGQEADPVASLGPDADPAALPGREADAAASLGLPPEVDPAALRGQEAGPSASRGPEVGPAALVGHDADPVASVRPEGDPDDIGLGGAWSDVLLGLAADAVGLGRVAEARRLHAAAERVTHGWRTTIRTGWVAAEIELTASHPEQAVHWAERAFTAARSAPSTRHRVKSGLVLSAALVASATTVGRRRAAGLLREALSSSLERGIFSLSWPCALLLADLAPDEAPQLNKIASNALNSCFFGADSEMQRLAQASPWVPTHLVRFGEPTRTSGWLAS